MCVCVCVCVCVCMCVCVYCVSVVTQYYLEYNRILVWDKHVCDLCVVGKVIERHSSQLCFRESAGCLDVIVAQMLSLQRRQVNTFSAIEENMLI